VYFEVGSSRTVWRRRHRACRGGRPQCGQL